MSGYCNCSAHQHSHGGRNSSLDSKKGFTIPKFRGGHPVKEEANEDDSDKSMVRKRIRKARRAPKIPDHSSPPCRRCCSTIHNPVFHVGRVLPPKQKFRNPGAGRPARPSSADKAQDPSRKNADGSRCVDWLGTDVHNTILDLYYQQKAAQNADLSASIDKPTKSIFGSDWME